MRNNTHIARVMKACSILNQPFCTSKILIIREWGNFICLVATLKQQAEQRIEGGDDK
ncbi:hypothetical protein [Arsenophonus nasoniae]|uniref:Uncharacterized protein n=1 Tax=Arsenophonus nasoniae TaxID=638 RepID=A0AA95GQZ8_9GAMM|nr:hypothetical protein [Arsenophonus nasoniae]WGM03678.1 hypothetical protein QE210_19515 [Arsenophonus nasoniae]WGM08862.1 hypothetical protein QE258_26245 [Arsenophonus nasoniae]